MMKILVVFITCLSFQSFAQVAPAIDNRSCSVVCLNEVWIPESYNRGANAAIEKTATGTISVHETLDVSDREHFKRKSFISFKVAILKKDFDTMLSFSDDSFTRLEAAKVLAKCEKGDEIVIILTNPDKYSLPHHRIKVN